MPSGLRIPGLRMPIGNPFCLEVPTAAQREPVWSRLANECEANGLSTPIGACCVFGENG